MINFATLEAVRYPPELLPSCEYRTITTGNEGEVLNLTRLPRNLLVRLKDIIAVPSVAEQAVNAELRLKADSEVFQVSAGALPDRITEPTTFEPTQYDLLASSSVRLAVYAIGDLDKYKICHGLWVSKTTIADKLALEIPLNAEEAAIDKELGISKTVGRGTLPAKIDRFLLYEYLPIYRETKAIIKTVPTGGIDVETLNPRRIGEQFIVLEKISAETPDDADGNTRITIWRDDDGSPASPLLQLFTWSMGLTYDIPMFIPARREIGIRCETDTERSNYKIRYTFGIYLLNNILKMRWGLLTREDNPDLYKRVIGGIA
ncbi:unnamed protein product [marine sediment metagenome]|uniref:Uncharacterized protein n=1 Tax=marine sediment metagenome TaxID=412755 RepID=X1M098_9ZZZZ